MKTEMTWLLAGLLAGGNVMAADIEATLYPGQSTNSSVSVTLPSLPPAADVLFSFDCTASMGGVLATAESNAVSLVASLAATGVSFHFGVASFMDYPATYNSCGYSNTYGDATSGDYPYRLNQAMTTNTAAVTAAMNTLYIGYGVDGPEDYTRALYESYADTNVTWRSGAKRVMVNFGDSVPHDCNLNQGIPGTGGAIFSTGGDPGRDGIMGTSDDLVLLDVLAGMASNHVVLLAARLDDFGGGDYAFNYWTNWTAITGGKAFQSTNSTLIRDLMNEITNSLAIACVDNLHPVIAPPAFNSWLTITPPAYAQICSGDIGIFNLALTPPVGTPAGDYSFTLSIVDAQAVDYADKTVLIHVLPTVPLPVALNNNTLTWTTVPSLPWFGQTGVSHDSVASGRSFFIGDGQQSTLTTTTNGPGTFSFWWKVSSQTNADMLSFASYGGGITNPPTQISGETGWNQLRVLLGGGPQTLVWTYSKDASQSAGLDAGFVDQVSYVFGPTLPFIIVNPVSQSVSAGTPVTFSVLADGTPVLAYQWRLNGTDIPGATSNVFALPVPGDNDAGIVIARDGQGEDIGGSPRNIRAIEAPLISQNRSAVGQHREGHRSAGRDRLAHRVGNNKGQGRAEHITDLIHKAGIQPGTLRGVFGVGPDQGLRAAPQKQAELVPAGFPRDLGRRVGDPSAIAQKAQHVGVGLGGDLPPEGECARTVGGGGQGGLLAVPDEKAAAGSDAVVGNAGLSSGT